MAESAIQDIQRLEQISEYHEDAVDALKLFFDPVSAGAQLRYLFSSAKELEAIRNERIRETEFRSALVLLAAVEAAFRIDYIARCQQKKKDALSRDFRALNKNQKSTHLINLERQILELWATRHPELKSTIGELRSALRFRHWLAHGRYFNPKLGRRYDYAWLFLLARAVIDGFPLVS